MAGIGAGIAAVWALAGVYLGRAFSKRTEQEDSAGAISIGIQEQREAAT